MFHQGRLIDSDLVSLRNGPEETAISVKSYYQTPGTGRQSFRSELYGLDGSAETNNSFPEARLSQDQSTLKATGSPTESPGSPCGAFRESNLSDPAFLTTGPRYHHCSVLVASPVMM